jgi:type IV secretion system protein VirB2
MNTKFSFSNDHARRLCLAFLMIGMINHPASAQIAKLQSTANWVTTSLELAAIAIISVAILWVGFKMIFQHAKWSEVSNIVIGSVFIGGASAIASQLMSKG